MNVRERIVEVLCIDHGHIDRPGALSCRTCNRRADSVLAILPELLTAGVLTDAEAIAKLNALTKGDNEAAHVEADNILLAVVSPAVAAAYERAHLRVGGFWYA